MATNHFIFPDDLIDRLQSLYAADVVDIENILCNLPLECISNLEFPAEEQRIRQVLMESKEFQLILIIWGKNSSTPIHGHGGSDGFMKILKGEILESLYFPFTTTLKKESIVNKSNLTQVEDSKHFHKLLALSPSISLHLYCKPLKFIQTYLPEKNSWENVEV
ncbi:MAG: cysteine dioxygenase family protein [Bacteriovoracaceae bacterium]|nr:cysteine dioxygenase family protein [Bacteriovoracaceae bacterium]